MGCGSSNDTSHSPNAPQPDEAVLSNEAKMPPDEQQPSEAPMLPAPQEPPAASIAPEPQAEGMKRPSRTELDQILQGELESVMTWANLIPPADQVMT